MDEEKQREISRQGGRAAHEGGRGREFTPEEAREAGKKGGAARSQAQGSKAGAQSRKNS